LFLIEGADENKHYVWLKNLSRLIRGRTKHTGEKAFVCSHCLHPFSNKEIHDHHVLNCQRHPPQDEKYPDPEIPKESVLEFHNKAALFRLPFYLVCDFESFLTPDEGVNAVKATNIIDDHRVCGFACHRVSQYLNITPSPSCTADQGLLTSFMTMSFAKVK